MVHYSLRSVGHRSSCTFLFSLHNTLVVLCHKNAHYSRNCPVAVFLASGCQLKNVICFLCFVLDCPQCLFSRNKYSIWPSSSNGECEEDEEEEGVDDNLVLLNTYPSFFSLDTECCLGWCLFKATCSACFGWDGGRGTALIGLEI